MTRTEASRTARGCARVNPGHVERPTFVRAVTDGRETYRYVFAVGDNTFIVLKRNERKGYRSVKIWQTGDMDHTYDSWNTKLPVEPAEWMILDAWREIVTTIYAVAPYVRGDACDR